MPWFDTPDYWWTRFLLQRGLALVYLIGFLVAANQFRPLLGEDGLLPAPRFLDRVDFLDAPSLFHLGYSDRIAAALAWGGVGLSVLALTGVSDAFGTPLSMAVWAFLWASYLSFVNVGRIFYGYGWESLLLEAGFTDCRQRSETGRWWSRTEVGVYLPAVSLDQPAFRQVLERRGWIGG